MNRKQPEPCITRRALLRGAAAAALSFGALGSAAGMTGEQSSAGTSPPGAGGRPGASVSSGGGAMGEARDGDGGIIATRWDFPVVELRPLPTGSAGTVEEMIAGLPHNNPDINSASFPACQGGPAGEVATGLLLVKPLGDREHEPVDSILRRLAAAGLVPEGLPELALLKDHADELWAAGIYYVGALAANSICRRPDGGYVVYLIPNPADRGFHLQWIGADTAGGTVAVRDEYCGDLNGQLWFLVRRREPRGTGGSAASG